MNCQFTTVSETETEWTLRCEVCGRTVVSERPNYSATCRPGPSLAGKAINFARATAAHIYAGAPTATDEVVAERFSICSSNSCGLFTAKDKGSGICRHGSCGCGITLAAKAVSKLRWADSECPVGRWAKVTPGHNEA